MEYWRTTMRMSGLPEFSVDEELIDFVNWVEERATAGLPDRPPKKWLHSYYEAWRILLSCWGDGTKPKLDKKGQPSDAVFICFKQFLTFVPFVHVRLTVKLYFSPLFSPTSIIMLISTNCTRNESHLWKNNFCSCLFSPQKIFNLYCVLIITYCEAN